MFVNGLIPNNNMYVLIIMCIQIIFEIIDLKLRTQIVNNL